MVEKKYFDTKEIKFIGYLCAVHYSKHLGLISWICLIIYKWLIIGHYAGHVKCLEKVGSSKCPHSFGIRVELQRGKGEFFGSESQLEEGLIHFPQVQR